MSNKGIIFDIFGTLVGVDEAIVNSSWTPKGVKPGDPEQRLFEHFFPGSQETRLYNQIEAASCNINSYGNEEEFCAHMLEVGRNLGSVHAEETIVNVLGIKAMYAQEARPWKVFK